MTDDIARLSPPPAPALRVMAAGLALLAVAATGAIADTARLTEAKRAEADGEPVSPEEFARFAEGYTLYFERDGEPWGSESFGEDGSVTWRYPSGDCLSGVWRGYDSRVCFYYGPGSDVLCWRLSQEGEGYRARLLDGEEAGLELMITRRDRVPLLCGEGGAPL